MSKIIIEKEDKSGGKGGEKEREKDMRIGWRNGEG